MIPKVPDHKTQKSSSKGVSAKKPFFDVNRKKLRCFVKNRDELSVSPHCKSIEPSKDKESLKGTKDQLENRGNIRV